MKGFAGDYLSVGTVWVSKASEGRKKPQSPMLPQNEEEKEA